METEHCIITPPPSPCCTHTHLGENAPPLPVAQLQVGGTVPLEDFQGTELLLLLGKGPEGDKRRRRRRRKRKMALQTENIK